MYNHNKAQQSKNLVHISWDILYGKSRKAYIITQPLASCRRKHVSVKLIIVRFNTDVINSYQYIII